MKKICKWCSKEFESNIPHQKFHSKSCYEKDKSKRYYLRHKEKILFKGKEYRKRPRVKKRIKKYKKDYYKKNKEKFIKTTREWDKKNPEKKKESNKKALNKFRVNNPEKFNALMRENYKRNKTKYHSRSITFRIIYGKRNYKKTKIPINFFCKECGKKKGLQIHHEIYPTRQKEIEKAILDKKIYFLCKKCHLKKQIKRR